MNICSLRWRVMSPFETHSGVQAGVPGNISCRRADGRGTTIHSADPGRKAREPGLPLRAGGSNRAGRSANNDILKFHGLMVNLKTFANCKNRNNFVPILS
jgi:hypothetical protein